ncbi:MAG: haloacid dehalogenase type II [Alphaproteobacteria bacterium]|nr:haloacid dehalogenase type II [Alphaproteobacteria bacterium]
MVHTELARTETCVFDAYGTLFDVTSAAQRCADALENKADALATLWRTSQLQYTWLRSLMGKHADFWQVTGEALDHAMDALGISDDALKTQLIELYLVLSAYPDAKLALVALRRAKRPAAILSNGSPKMLAAAVTSAGLGDLLNAVLSVEDIGVYKPHPTVYQLAVERLGVPAARICFVSSNGWDAVGASAFGMNAVWVNRSGLKIERLPAKPITQIKRLDELPTLLGL